MNWIVQASTVPQQLYAAADAYDDAAGRLRRVLAMVPEYFALIEEAERVHWDSMASRAFRTALEALRIPGELVTAETAVLASRAETIASDLRSYGDQARQLMLLISSGGQMFGHYMQLAQDEVARNLAVLTVDILGSNDVSRFMQLAQEGGVRQLLGLPNPNRGIPIGEPGSPAVPTH
ncbi:hypothetical protein GCM10011359_04830 [Nesterenkonia alkaliphila]|nr:hypothetical protein GCM10011359_04830 [Nesterenkonia alkaliphila]